MPKILYIEFKIGSLSGPVHMSYFCRNVFYTKIWIQRYEERKILKCRLFDMIFVRFTCFLFFIRIYRKRDTCCSAIGYALWLGADQVLTGHLPHGSLRFTDTPLDLWPNLSYTIAIGWCWCFFPGRSKLTSDGSAASRRWRSGCFRQLPCYVKVYSTSLRHRKVACLLSVSSGGEKNDGSYTRSFVSEILQWPSPLVPALQGVGKEFRHVDRLYDIKGLEG